MVFFVLLGLLAIVIASWSLFVGQIWVLFILMGIPLVIALLRWPSWPMVIGYALIIPVWPYFLPYVGRPEVIVSFLSLLGILILMLQRELPKLNISPIVMIGIYLFFGSYLVSWAANPLADSGSHVFSLATRLVFFFLTYFLLVTRKQLMWSLGLYIAFSLVPAIYVLFANLMYGWGFWRINSIRELFGTGHQNLSWSVLYSANQGGAAAVLLLGLYPLVHRRISRLGILFLSSFLFFTAFAAQFRREMLITPVIILLVLLIDNSRNLRRPAMIMLVIYLGLFFIIIKPSSVFQVRLQETEKILMGTDTRMVSAEAGFDAFLEKPILGHGPSSYRSAVAPFVKDSRNSWAFTPYNVFVWTLVESGIFGFVGIGLILIGMYRQGGRLKGDLPMVEAWVFRSAPILVVLFFIWFSLGNRWDLSQPWYLMGAIMAAARLNKNNNSDMQPRGVCKI